MRFSLRFYGVVVCGIEWGYPVLLDKVNLHTKTFNFWIKCAKRAVLFRNFILPFSYLVAEWRMVDNEHMLQNNLSLRSEFDRLQQRGGRSYSTVQYSMYCVHTIPQELCLTVQWNSTSDVSLSYPLYQLHPSEKYHDGFCSFFVPCTQLHNGFLLVRQLFRPYKL
jgi:hypothetical protein